MPAFLRIVIARLKALFRRDAVAGEIHEELQFHMEMRAAEYERRGSTREQARRQANQRVGSLALAQDRGYDIRGGGVLETVLQDVRYTFRLWKRQPVFAAIAIATLALGIGASTALFSMIDAAVLRPLPYPHPEQLVSITVAERLPNGDEVRTGPSLADARDWRRLSDTISAVGVIRTGTEPFLVDAGRGPERLPVSEMGESCFDVYQRAPVIGRGFSEADLSFGAPPVVMLSFGYWQSRFAGARDAIGHTVRIGTAAPATIIGVTPQQFYERSALWRPHVAGYDPRNYARRRGTGNETYARLRPGVTIATAQQELTRVIQREEIARGSLTTSRIVLRPLLLATEAGQAAVITILVAAVALVLAITCVNVAGLLIARGATRLPELAIRASIGAGRMRLTRQLLTEGTLLAVAGGATGVTIAWLGLSSLISVIPLEMPDTSTASINALVLAFALALSVGTSLVFGLVPAMVLSRRATVLHALSGHKPFGSALSRRSGQLLIAVEVSIAIVLLVCAGLLVRSLDRALNVDLGFAPRSAFVMYVSPVDQRAGVVSTYYPALLAQLRAHPDVSAAGAIDSMHLSDSMMTFGFATSPAAQDVDVEIRRTLTGYIEAVGLRIQQGRVPPAEDFATGRFIVINEAAAKELFPSGNAVGQSVSVSRTIREVAAVVANIRRSALSSRVSGEVLELTGDAVTAPVEVVVQPRPGSKLTPANLRDIAEHIGTPVYVDRIVPATTLGTERLAAPTHRALLFSLLSGLAFVLTLVGIFGTTSYAVAQRTREVGVRMAFGARPGQVVGTILGQAAAPILLGIVTGLISAAFATRLIAAFLFETTPTDLVTFATVAGVLAMSGLLAAWIPARRAARVDPVIALRSD